MNQEATGANTPESGETPVITVKDRRFWARKSEAEASAEGTAEGAEPAVEAAAEGAEAQGEAEAAPKKPAYVEELEQKLAQKEQRLADTLVQYKEALDEFEAAKARLRRDIGKEIESGKRNILTDLLDVMDNLERAVSSSQGPKADVTSLLGGVTMVRDQFLAKLEGFGVTRFNALNAPFDPSRCEAVSIVPVPDTAQDGKVVGVVRDCYLMGSETLRHGMVAVGKGPASDADTQSEAQEQESA